MSDLTGRRAEEIEIFSMNTPSILNVACKLLRKPEWRGQPDIWVARATDKAPWIKNLAAAVCWRDGAERIYCMSAHGRHLQLVAAVQTALDRIPPHILPPEQLDEAVSQARQLTPHEFDAMLAGYGGARITDAAQSLIKSIATRGK